MNKVSSIKTLWQKMAEECTTGLVKRGLDIPSSLKMYCTYQSPEGYCGVAFSFNQDIKIDIIKLQDLLELSISLFKDNSFSDSKLLLVQLNNQEGRTNDIFASICWNLANSIINIDSEQEAIHLVISLLNKWRGLFTKKRKNPLSLQEQQGLYGELTFLSKLFNLNIVKSSVLDLWKGPYLAPQDFSSDIWAVEVKTVLSSKYPKVSINGEKQLDETPFEKLYLYVLVIDDMSQGGETLPELVADLRKYVVKDSIAREKFENKLVLSGYFDSDEEAYKNRNYRVYREYYYLVQNEFPRLRKEDLRNGISEVKYTTSLATSEDCIVEEQVVFNTIMSYEGNKQVL